MARDKNKTRKNYQRYIRSVKGRAMQRRYRQSAVGRAAAVRRRSKQSYKDAQRRYAKSSKGRLKKRALWLKNHKDDDFRSRARKAKKKYLASEKGKATYQKQRKAYASRRRENQKRFRQKAGKQSRYYFWKNRYGSMFEELRPFLEQLYQLKLEIKSKQGD